MESLKESVSLLISSVIGAFIGAAFRKDETSFNICLAIVAGIAMAYYLTPALIEVFGISKTVENAIAFLIGLFGMYLLTIVVMVLKALKDDPKEVLETIKQLIFRR